MARVVITIEDEEGGVTVVAECDPPVSELQEETPAHHVAAQALQAISRAVDAAKG